MDSIRNQRFQRTSSLGASSHENTTHSETDSESEEQSNPYLFESVLVAVADEMEFEEEQAEGERHEQELLEKHPLWENEEAQLLLESIHEQLEPFLQREEPDYLLLPLDCETPFASSCPNGTIFFTRALLQALSPKEVLFFAAHELAHTELRHYASRSRRLSELRQLIPAAPGSTARQRLDFAAVLCVRHQEEFEADLQACLWVGKELGSKALETLHQLCQKTSPTSLQRPTHPHFEKRVLRIEQNSPFVDPLKYLYSLLD